MKDIDALKPSILELARRGGHQKIVALLEFARKEMRINPSYLLYFARDEEGRSALHLAVLYNNVKTLENLLKYLNEGELRIIQFRDNEGKTPVDYLTATNYIKYNISPEIIDMLAKYGELHYSSNMEKSEELIENNRKPQMEVGRREKTAQQELLNYHFRIKSEITINGKLPSHWYV